MGDPKVLYPTILENIWQNHRTMKYRPVTYIYYGVKYQVTWPHYPKEFVHTSDELNQRTNGPVNPHLISGATVSTKTSFAKFDSVLKWVKVNSGSSFI